MAEEKSITYKPYSIGIALILTILWAVNMIVQQKELFPWWLFIGFWLAELVIGSIFFLAVIGVAKKI